jgi:hypothetical protein
MPVVAALLALSALAGNTVVSAAPDAWEAARKGFARLIGRGNPDKTQAAERRLEDTRTQLTQAEGADAEQVRTALVAQWTTRMSDLLEDDPAVEADLRALVEEIRAQLPAHAVVTAADHAVAVAGDQNITASGGGVAAGVIHGNARHIRPRASPSGRQLCADAGSADRPRGS